MGHRANSVLIENGQHSIFFSRWGAAHAPAVPLAGPAVTVAYIRGLTPVETLLDDPWAEGGMLCDLDRRSYSVWGGFDLARKPYLRCYLLAAVRRLWPGWQVEWMNDDLVELANVELANVVGLEPATLMDAQPPRQRQRVQVTPSVRNAHTLSTLRRPPKWVTASLLREHALRAVLLGPPGLNGMVGSQRLALPNEREKVRRLPTAFASISTHRRTPSGSHLRGTVMSTRFLRCTIGGRTGRCTLTIQGTIPMSRSLAAPLHASPCLPSGPSPSW
jgi:hypothetical protein